VSTSVTLEPSPPRQTRQSRLADCASSPLGLPSPEAMKKVPKNVILSGAQCSEESRRETPRPFASLRVTGDSVCAGGSETRPYDPASSPPKQMSQSRLGESASSPLGLPSSEGLETIRGHAPKVQSFLRSARRLREPAPPTPSCPSELADDAAVEDALWRSAMAGSIRAQVFWLVNRAPQKWRPVGRMSFMPRMPSVASMLRVSEPRLREWAYRARSLSSRSRPLRNTETRSARRSPKRGAMIRPRRAPVFGTKLPPLSPPNRVLQTQLAERAPCPLGLPSLSPLRGDYQTRLGVCASRPSALADARDRAPPLAA